MRDMKTRANYRSKISKDELIIPWKKDQRPKTFVEALQILMNHKKYRLSPRQLAISSGVTRLRAKEWISGERVPNELEIRDIVKAFCFKRFGLIISIHRKPLQNELNEIIKNQ